MKDIATLAMQILNNIDIILVEPSHPGNIGSSARAMKTMGLSNLKVVTSKNIITDESVALSKGAKDVLEKAQVFATLDDALKDVNLVAGTSARIRSIDLPLYQPHEAAINIAKYWDKGNRIGIVFGRERTGLTNEELLKCDFHINIDANLEYSSLNLAMSVQVISYELRQRLVRNLGLLNENDFEVISDLTNNIEGAKNKEEPSLSKNTQDAQDLNIGEYKKPTHEDLESYYRFLEQNLTNCGFLKGEHNTSVLAQLRRIYAKANLTKHELQILYGTQASLIKHATNSKK